VGGAWRVVDHSVDVLDLENGIGQDLGRSVVDLLRQPLALGLLGLNDAQRTGGLRVIGLSQ
jgi:hypothetical protein